VAELSEDAGDPRDRPLPAEAAGSAPGRGRLTGRRILVVGAGTQGGGRAPADKGGPSGPGGRDPVGNGQAIARLAAREGAEVVCADRDADALTRTAEAIAAEGGRAETRLGDVSDAATCERMVTDSGALDGLVCNVGIGAGRGLAGTSPEDWDRVMAVNLRAHFLLARAAVPVLRPGGSIVFIGSVAGLQPGTGVPVYDTTKAGLLGLSRHVALEAARRGGRANVVVPGLIDTPLGRAASAGRASRDRTPVALRRQGTAWEVAYATVFLLSEEASYITGQRLVVDGGLAWG
jgi:NAD(P)-dependent dehydrogenase (short-subunit alcohol dehydrogenase family)